MGANLLKAELKLEAEKAAKVRADWRARYAKEGDAMGRMEIVTEMAQLEDRETIGLLLELLGQEKDSGVRQQIVLVLGYMGTTQKEIKAVAGSFMNCWEGATNSVERDRILEVISNLPMRESVEFVTAIFERADGKQIEQRISAAKGLFKLAPRVVVPQERVDRVTAWLREQAKSGATENRRLQAAQVLAMPGQRNQAYLGELAASERDPKVKTFLLLAAKEYPAE